MILLASSSPSSVSTVTFNNIDQTYTHLKVLFTLRFDGRATEDELRLTFNGSGSSYSWTLLRGSGSSVSSTSGSSASHIQCAWLQGTNATSNTFSNGQIHISNYTTGANKTVGAENVPESNSADVLYSTLCAGAWANSAAITSLTLSAGSSFVGSIWLYGIS